MPGNEIEGRIHRLYELENYSRQSQVADGGNWPGFVYNQWHEKQREISEPLSFTSKNNIHQLDSARGQGCSSLNVSFDQDYTQSTQRPGLSNIQPRQQHLKTNDYMLGRDILQARQNQPEFLGDNTGFGPLGLASRGFSILKSEQENASGDSPTLTTNSERSEITEASTEINFVGSQQQLVRGQQPQGIPQHHSMQQSGYNDMQLMQQHLMFKQLQELQRQQQLQQFGDSRQQNSVNQLSAIAKQAAGVQFSPLINGTPVNENPHMLMNWVQRGASPAGQHVSNRISFPQEQGQTLRSMGQAPQQLDVSLYGTPVTSGRGTLNQYSHLPQGMSHDSVNLMTKASNQAQKPTLQASVFSNSFVGDRCTTPDQVCLPQEANLSKQGFQGKNAYGEATSHGLNYGSSLGNLQQETVMQTNTSLQQLSENEEQDGWTGISSKNTLQHGSSQGLVALDPMEEKILYNTDDSLWDPSLLNCNDIGGGGLGSWSALMQSAVADSSSDTGLHEEWSGISFQNTELSASNQPSSILESEKQQGSWADNNLQAASSFSSKTFPLLNDSGDNSSFPGFQQPGIQYKPEPRESLHQDESIQNSPRSNSQWLDHNPRQQLSSGRSQQAQQTLEHLDNTWVSHTNQRSECDAPLQRIDPYGNVCQPSSKLEGRKINIPLAGGNPANFRCHNTLGDCGTGDSNEAMHKRNFDGALWNRDGDTKLTSFSSSAGQLERVESGLEDTLRTRQNSHIFNFPSVQNAQMIKAQPENQQGRDEEHEDDGVAQKQRQMSNSSPAIPNFYGRDGKTYEQQNCYQKDNAYDHKSVDISPTAYRSVGPSGVHVTAGTSQNMLELLNKVSRPKESSSVAQFDSSGFSPLSEITDAHRAASFDQMYNQSSASQGFALKLSPPSLRQSNSNSHFFSQGLPQPARHIDSPSSQSLPRSHESSPRAHWDDKFSLGGQSSVSPSYMHGSSIAEITSSPTFRRNQPQTQALFNPPVPGPSAHATFPATIPGHPPSNLARSQDTPQQTFVNPDGQRFPILESVPVSHPSFMSGVSPQGGVPFRQQSLLTNTSSRQHLSGTETQKVPMVTPSSDSRETSSTMRQVNNLNPGYKSSDFGAQSLNLQGFSSQEEQHEKERTSPKPMFSGMLEASKTGPRNVPDPGGPNSESLSAHSNLQELNSIQNGDSNVVPPLARNLQYLAHALNPSQGFCQNYSLLQQMQAMKNMATDPNRRDVDVRQATVIAEQQSMYDHNKDGELNSASHLKSLPHGSTSIQSFSSDSRGDPSLKTLPQSSQQGQVMVAFGESGSQSQSTGNVTSIHGEASRANLYMAANWFKQYGNLRNGQIPFMHDARTAAGQFSLTKPSQSLNIPSSVDQIDASDASQNNRVANCVPSAPLIAPCVLQSDASNQSMDIVRPKKRKIATCDLSWHKVTERSKEVQDFSDAEEDWALASNRLSEKVLDEFGMIEDGEPIIQAKRRLISSTQFLQHLLGPAPASILSADAAQHYDSVIYCVAKSSVGDACSLTCSQRNSTDKPNSEMIMDELKVAESNDDRCLSKVVVELTDRSKKLENELLRLDKAASILDVRLECQELERFSVINRFAKYHLPRADMSGTSSGPASRPMPQRYVTGQPLPKNLPEGVQCLSL